MVEVNKKNVKNILKLLIRCAKILDKQNVPTKDRWIYFNDENVIARLKRMQNDKLGNRSAKGKGNVSSHKKSKKGTTTKNPGRKKRIEGKN